MAVLAGDPTKRGCSPCGCRHLPVTRCRRHTHPTAENITVISGTFNVGTGDKFDEAAGKAMDAGGYMVMPPGMKHYAWTPAEIRSSRSKAKVRFDQIRKSGRRSA